MKRRVAGILMAAVFVFAGATGLSIGLQPPAASARPLYRSPEHDFSVAFPATPEVDGHPAQSRDASAYWTYSAEHDGGSFLVRVDQYPAGIPLPAPSQRTYELLLGAHAKEIGSRLVSTRSVPLGAVPAVEGVFVDVAGVMEKRRVVMVGRRLYQVAYTRGERAGASAIGDAFLASFRLPGR